MTGWQYVHVAVDDCSRLAYAEVLPNERATTAVGLLQRALAFFGRYGVRVERILTYNHVGECSTGLPKDAADATVDPNWWR